ncbi:response regulator of citrate/malate metabolism [Halobacteria archaeon AArc-m2/3/4]|uniref:Response regulator of citrate/malate metabolism n=1 Tax=Natronoglomus mannanivorans TaxID=2979990 RepID=A0ABT2QJ55_9EURY|nr:response regulator of citrate/malate metabolism [Halobacteria archaeon AArc-m2/3/4]
MAEQGRKNDEEFDSKIADEDVITVSKAAETPVLTTSLVAEELPVTAKAVYYRLRRLHDEGRVGQMKVDARGIVWWVADKFE